MRPAETGVEPAPAAAPLRSRLPAGLLQATPFLVFLAVVLAVPFVLLITYSFRESAFLGVGPGPTFEQYQSVFTDSVSRRIMSRSLAIGLGVSAISTVLAFVLAYGIRFRLSRRAGYVALGLVFAAGIASFLVRIYAWGTILGTNGLINSALRSVGIIDESLGFLFFGYFAIVATMVYLYLPLNALLVLSAMQEIDRFDAEASRDLGAGRWRTALRVIAPQAKTGLLAAFALTAILASTDYITPQLVGGTRGQMVGTLVQGLALTNGDYPAAAALAMSFLIAVLLALAVLAALFRFTRGARRAVARQVDRVVPRMTALVPTRVARLSLSRLATFALLAYLVAPTLVVIVFSVNDGRTLGLPWRGFTLHWYAEVVRDPGFFEALLASARITAAAVVVGVAIGVPMAFALSRSTGAAARALTGVVFLPYAVPGVLMGVAVLVAAVDRGIQLGAAVTSLVHIVIVAPVVALVVNARLSGLDGKLVEAARDLGASRATVLRTIMLPLITPSIFGAALIGAAYSLDEILATSFTIGTGSTIPIFLLGQARTGFGPDINALGVMMMVGTLLAFAVAAALLRGTLIRRGDR